ncbi:MAG: 16S rRNA (uracil(1498)-N(3))-methyltransferase [Parachlamydiales bacterium]|nr:16S rRNA (uracil(1498)-N(3))-methyltransferase [Parachlamydiales bacterium]
MPAERFFIDADLQGTLSLEGTELHHLAHVMRIRIGEEVELVNGRGGLATARLEALSKHEAQLKVLNSSLTPLPSPRLKLAIPLMRPAKLELVIEKCTELGANSFYLYPAQYSEKDDLSEHAFERLQHIAISAMKQCGRLDLPEIQMWKFDEILALPIPIHFGDTREAEAPPETKEPIVFITGPEKGFSKKEIEALDLKAIAVRLHKNILRAETAPIVACVHYTSN